ncbi:MAG: transposase [Thermodesulfobacteriota bacterium]|nr:transposase [Thermodesulfobacteriota bacterium]
MTICTKSGECLFGDIIADEMVLNDAGRMVQRIWNDLPLRFTNMELDKFVIMPNHIHGIIVLNGRGEPCVRPDSTQTTALVDCQSGEHKVRPYGTRPDSIGRIVQAFKSEATNAYINGVKQHAWPRFPGKVWQGDYYDHIIRNQRQLDKIRNYIINNPKKWQMDRENPRVRQR